VPVSKDQSQLNLARKVVRLERVTRGLKPESKFSDVSLNITNASQVSGSSVQINQIAQGTTNSTRVGNSIDIKSVYIACSIATGATSFDLLGDYYWRVMVVLDTDAGVTYSGPGNLVVDQPSLPVNMLYNNLYLKRFRIMYDSGPMLINAIQSTPGCDGVRKTMLRKFVKIPGKNLRMDYIGAGATNLTKKSLSFIVYTNANVAAADSLDVVGSARCTFTDV